MLWWNLQAPTMRDVVDIRAGRKLARVTGSAGDSKHGKPLVQ
jgi:hypothetical protein